MDKEEIILISGFLTLLFLVLTKGLQWTFEFLALFYVSNTILYYISRKIFKKEKE